MDFPSETTKKERRNLLAAGYAGIIVAKLKIFPTEVEALGMKFGSVDLPFVVVAGLGLATVYFLIKFTSSYLYEWSQSESERLIAQLREGKTSMDVSREEETLQSISRDLIEKRRATRAQIEQDRKYIEDLQAQIDNYASNAESALTIMRKKRQKLADALGHIYRENKELYGSEFTEEERKTRKELAALDRQIKELEGSNAGNPAALIEKLETEKRQRPLLWDESNRKLEISENEVASKINWIQCWKRAHKTSQKVSRVHSFLEFYFPIIVGLLGIGSLLWFGINPPQPKVFLLPDI